MKRATTRLRRRVDIQCINSGLCGAVCAKDGGHVVVDGVAKCVKVQSGSGGDP